MPIGIVKFADFELDGRRYELRRGGCALKLEKIPMDVLMFLVERGNELVTREEIVERIWGKDVFLDTEHGINTAIRKIRTALRDNPDQPRFVQTVTGKGYRFIAATVSGNGDMAAPAQSTTAANEPEAKSTDVSTGSFNGFGREERLPHFGSHGVLSGAGSRVAAAIVIVALVAGFAVWGMRDRIFDSAAKPQIHSLAVLPLENLSADPAQEYFADGMTDELITRLAQNPSIRVISRTSVMQYKKVHRPLTEVARELGVDGILEGSVERSGKRIHLNAQLIYAPQDRHLWAESFDRDLNDLASLQSELSQTIARQVGLTAFPVVAPERHISPEAHDAYLLGRYYWFGQQYDKSNEQFLKAIQLQPDYAAAHAALADSYIAPVVLGAPKAELQEAMTKAERAARQALALDDSVAETHISMAAIDFFFSWNWEAAEREAARAVELNPRYSEAHHLRAYILLALQRDDEAVQEDRISMEIDPRIRPWALGFALLRTRQFDAALAELAARTEVQPDDTTLSEILSDLYWQKGMVAESVRELSKAYVPKSASELREAFRSGGSRGAVEWRLAHLKKLQSQMYVSPLALALAAARAGHKEETLRYLEQSYDEHVPWLAFVGNEPDLDFIHSEPRYQAIVRKMKLPSLEVHRGT